MVHNDPYNGGSHQADVLIARPIFCDGELVAFAANKGHWIDVGGASAGGWGGDATHVVQEGLIIPPVKLYKAGELQAEIRDFILRNVRLPAYVWGDIQAQIASNLMAKRRIHELAANRGVHGLKQTMEAVIDYSRRHFQTHLASFPVGIADAEDVMEDDAHGGGPHPIRVHIRVGHRGVLIDFAGTAKQVASPINASLTCTRAAAYAAAIAAIDPAVPISSGCLDLITVKAPEGSILNPRPPAPVFAGTADPADRAAETVLRAFADLDPSRISAGSYATGNNMTGYGTILRADEESEFLWYVFESGGCGARAEFDGNSAEWHLMANCKNESMEIWEYRYPLRFISYRLVPDSGGPGRRRGGLGTERQFELLVDTTLSATADRHKIPPWPLAGGLPGMCNSFMITREGRSYRPSELGARSDSKFSGLHMRAGDVLTIRQGGGGGFGPPTERTVDEVDRDLRLGYVTADEGERVYAVVADRSGETAAVDRPATERLRAKSSR